MNSLSNTSLSERQLLIHAIQHLEILTEQVGELHAALAPLRPMLGKLSARKRMFP